MAEPTGGKSFPLSVVIQAVDKITAPLKSITNTIAAAGGKISGLGTSLGRIADRSGIPVLAASLGRVGGAATGVVQAGGQVLGMFTRLAATAGLTAGGVGLLAQSYADATGAIGDTAERTGISRERLQELGYAAQMAGSSAENMQGALAKMNLTLGSVRGGSKELTQMFDGLRISLKNTDGSAKSTDEVFNSIVGQLAKIKDPALQAKAAVTIFGKSATELLPLIRGGTAGLEEMAAEARRLGVVLSDSAVRDGEAFGDVLDNLKFSMQGVGNSIGAALIPVLTSLGTMLTETIVKYRPQIEAFAAAFAQKLPTYIDRVAQGFQDFYDAMRPVGASIMWLVDNFGAVNTILGALAVVIGAVVIPPLVALGSAIVGVGVALLTTPIGWFMGAVALLAGGAYLIYKNWDRIAAFFTDKFTAVKDAFKTYVIDGITNLWNEFNPVKLVGRSFDAIGERFKSIDVGGLGSRLSGFFGGSDESASSSGRALPDGGAAAALGASSQAKVTVDFKNLPTGATVDTAASPGAQIATNQGYSMLGGMP